MIPPRKPFPEYKWRWATLTPTEGLSSPPIFLGVLRVLFEHEGAVPSSAHVEDGLARVTREVADQVDTRLRLVRTVPSRNLLRNSQQYWKALGVLRTTRNIELTELGRSVARGDLTRDEFAGIVVSQLQLPNPHILSANEVELWRKAGIAIKPLQLLLSVMASLGRYLGPDKSFITSNELTQIVIPLAGDPKSTLDEYVDSIRASRAGTLDLHRWPDCTPEANDRRMAREFLLFLSRYGLCRLQKGRSNRDDRFELSSGSADLLEPLLAATEYSLDGSLPSKTTIIASGGAVFAEREFVMRNVRARPAQTSFRKAVLGAYDGRCVVTGERIVEVLEAAHVIPVEFRGADIFQNSFCLRSDIHRLFDANHLRFGKDGTLTTSLAMRDSINYTNLPLNIEIPKFVSQEALEWRFNYV